MHHFPIPRTALAATFGMVLIYFCLFADAGALGLIGPDEPRYVSVAREMAETGDWVTPRLNGQPWFEKPILYYWLTALSLRTFGVSEAAARLPSAVAATLTLLALAWIAWRAYGPTTAYIFSLLFPTTVAAIAFGRAATTDMLFAAALSLALVAAARVTFAYDFTSVSTIAMSGPPLLRVARSYGESVTGWTLTLEIPRGSRLGWLIAWGAFLGLGILAKGPAAAVLAAGGVGLWIILTRQWKLLSILAHPIAIAACLAVALPWYLLCAARNPDFVRVFLIEHNVERYLTSLYQHEQPFWYFGPVLLLGLLPWTALLAPLVRHAWNAKAERAWKESFDFFLICWVIFPIIFFSFSRSKLPGYILPAGPPLVLLMARSAAMGLERRSREFYWALASVGLTFVGLAFAGGIGIGYLPYEATAASMTWLAAVLLVFGTAGLVVAALALRRHAQPALMLSAALAAGLIFCVTRTFVPSVDGFLTARNTARDVVRKAASRPIFVHRVRYAWRYGLDYYLHRELPEWTEPHLGLVITSDAGVQDLVGRGYGIGEIERPARDVAILNLAPRSPGSTQ